jgi:WD40 repeat protein
LTFDPSGQRLVLYHGNFARAEILDLNTGERTAAFESPDVSWSVAWRPDGKVIAGAAGSRLELWDVDARRTLAFLQGHEDRVVHIRFSHDGNMLLSYSWDGQSVLWDARTRHPLLRFSLAYPVFSPEDQRVAGTVAEDLEERVKIFELDHALERRRLVGTGDPTSLSLARGAFDRSSGLLIISEMGSVPGTSGLREFDVDSGLELVHLLGPFMRKLSIAPDGRFMLVGHEDGLYRWPMQREKERLAVGPPELVLSTSRVNYVDISANGRAAIAAISGQAAYPILDLQAAAIMFGSVPTAAGQSWLIVMV